MVRRDLEKLTLWRDQQLIKQSEETSLYWKITKLKKVQEFYQGLLYFLIRRWTDIKSSLESISGSKFLL